LWAQQSPPRAASSRPRGIGSLLSGTSIGEHRLKRLRAEGGSPIGLSQQPPPTQVTSDHEGEGMPSCAWVRGRWARLFSMMPSKFWNRQPPWPRYPRSLLENMGPSPRRSIPRAVYHHLPSTCVWNDVGLLCSLPLLVLELGICWVLF
jgi:hypothetical protein